MKKAQAALEFLTTYGWAFLIILIMIGALAYFGVLNPKIFLPDRCTFSPEVSCTEFQIIQASNNLSFMFRNNAGGTADFTFNSTYLAGAGIEATSCTSANQLAPGRVAQISCIFPNPNFPKGEKAKFEMIARFKLSDGNYWQVAKGEIYGTVQ